MKAFKLREEKSFIKVLKEPPKKVEKVNWSRRIYLGLFSLVGLFILNNIFSAYFLIIADGQLELPKQTLSFPDDIEILAFFIEEGQKVEKGDSLFQYKVSADASQLSSSITSTETKDWLVKEKFSLKKQLEIARIKLKMVKREVEIIEQKLTTKESLLLLGLNEEYKNCQSLNSDKFIKLSEIKTLKSEIQLYTSQLNSLTIQEKEYVDSKKLRHAQLTETKTFFASKEGTISDIFYEINEICYKKEELMTLHKNEGASITTYFNPEEITHIKEGDIVDVEFPDGSNSKGVISKLLVSTYALPSEFQKKYEPTERNIVAEVVPLLKSDEKAWNNFYKIDVKINKWRYNLFK